MKPQHYKCPNCGADKFDSFINMNHVLSLMCSDECRKEFNLKYSSMIVGKTYEIKVAKQ